MSSDFYLKSQTLYEEFKKKDLNVPLQGYLQKIHEREKKNEEMYQSIMKQMNELDQHTDLLCSKIDKLEIFRSIQVGHNLNDTNYPLISRYNSQFPNTLHNFKTKVTVPHFESNSLKSSTLKTVSTQTENNVLCDNCKSVIPLSFQMSQMQNSTSSVIDVLSISKEEPQIINPFPLQDDSFSVKNNNYPHFMTSSLNTEDFPSQICENSRHVEEILKNGLQSNEKHEAKCPVSNTMFEEDKQLSSAEALIIKNPMENSENKQFTASQSKLNDSKINAEISMSKSDVDSVNNEFDFLESDTTQLSSKIKSQTHSKSNTVPPNNDAKNTDQATSLDVKLSKSSVKLQNEKQPFQLDREQEMSDNRSETSESISGTHSPAISLSDSDSVNEKGSFTTSAAYQSLLGNTVLPSKINKQVLESESEDEVEKTLAHTIQKPNMKTKPSAQSKKDKNVPQSTDAEPFMSKPKPVSMNKQSKLSKNTKKVLGIDTSSSSEIENAVKPPQNKKDEDSDEFDFYD